MNYWINAGNVPFGVGGCPAERKIAADKIQALSGNRALTRTRL